VQRRDFIDTPSAWDAEVDLLVVGAGAAGMTAALVAAIEGCRVLVCEKSSKVGGTTARSSGGIWVPGNHQTERAGRPDSLADARRYLAAELGAADPRDLREAYLQAGPEAIDYLERHSDVRFAPMAAYPDYRDLDGASKGGRPLASLPFDGRLLGKDFELVAPPLPSLVALGGMMVGRADIPHLLHPFSSWQSFKTSTRLVGRYLVDRVSHSRGTSLLMGNALAARLFYSLKKNNVPIWFGTAVTTLIREGGSVVGAEVKTGAALTTRRVRALRGVVLATGGFSHSAVWRERLMSSAEKHALSLACESNTGDGLTMAAELGVDIGRGSLKNACVWTPVSQWPRPGRAALIFPHLFLDRPKPGFIAVNKAGQRFVNEASSYHDFVAAMLSSADTASNLPAYLICDHAALKRHGLGMVLPGGRNLRAALESGYVVCADTVAQLASKLGIAASDLEATVARTNRFAATGVDEDFGKGQSFFNRFHGDERSKPNPCLGPIEEAPFHAVAIWPADLSTFAGITVNRHAQALDAELAPIAGLHVCGNDMKSIWQGEAPGPGVTLGPAIVFGYVAAMHAVHGASAASEAATEPAVTAVPMSAQHA
jgi:succinate dehydrogenase/fumarate reductase flavoprotein subunit